MRLSHLFFKTLKDAPADADIASHQLLERGGYIHKLGRGLYIYTPLMQRVMQKLCARLRQELEAVGVQECSLPQLHPRELWETSGRWKDYTAERLLYTVEDREGHDYCMAPTHEEAILYLVRHWVTSYKQLPLILHQIGNKFRDEIRPRFGLIRSKEFLMHDGYSFGKDKEEMAAQYELMRGAYSSFFEKLGLDFVIVGAHGGKIGGSRSEEFQVKTDIGEDVVMSCGDIASNVEATVSIPPSFHYNDTLLPLEEIATPDMTSIETLAAFTKQPAEQILKTIVYKLIYKDRKEFVAIGIRGDRQCNTVKVGTHFEAVEIELATDEEIAKACGTKRGFIGPLDLQIPFYADHTTEAMTNFVCAKNKVDVHAVNVNWDRDVKRPKYADFLLAEAGDSCPHVTGGVYKEQRGTEVGHIFHLGTKYSEKLQGTYQDEKGEQLPYWMGTYGIGMGRTAQACVEQKYDERGIVWPMAIAPYKILITAATHKDEELVAESENIYEELAAFEPLLDDRDERLGFKLKDSDLIGMPFKMIIGKSWKKEGKLEIESRLGGKFLVPRQELLTWAKEHL